MLKSLPPRAEFSLSETPTNPESATSGLPHSREAEEAVIGSVLIAPDIYYDLMDIIRADDIYIIRLRFIWDAYCSLAGSGTPIDILLTCEELDRMGHLDEVGGAAYLTALLNQSPSILNAEYYAQIVADMARRRKYLEIANKMAQLAYDESKPLDVVEEEIERSFGMRETAGKTTIVTANDAADELERQIDEGVAQGVPSSINPLNDLIGGYPKKAVSLTYGGSNLGKTALALQEAESVSFGKERVLYISLESSTDRMVARRVFSQAGVPMKTMRNNSMTPEQKTLVKRKIKDYKTTHHNLVFDDKARTLAGIDRSIKQHRPAFVVIDDLMHIKPEKNSGRQSSDVTLLLETVMRLKDIAIDRDCHIFIIHSMTAAEVEKFWAGPENKRTSNVAPSLDALGWAKDLLYRVDLLFGLVPDFTAKRTDDVLKVILWDLKDREGETFHAIELYFNRPEQWFYDNTTLKDMRYIPQLPVNTKPIVSAMESLPKPKPPVQGALLPRRAAPPPRMDFTDPPEEDDYFPSSG